MQSPILVFDHISKVVATVQPGPTEDRTLADVLTAQQEQVSTASGLPPR